MKGMIRQELKNYFKNPLYWVGILFILYGLFQILSPYLDVHYFHSKQEVQQTKPESLADADIMDGYVKSTEKERIDLAAKKIQSMIVKEFGEDAENVRKAVRRVSSASKTKRQNSGKKAASPASVVRKCARKKRSMCEKHCEKKSVWSVFKNWSYAFLHIL